MKNISHGIRIKVLGCGLKVNKFKFQFPAPEVFHKCFHLIYMRKFFVSFRAWKRWKSLCAKSGECGRWSETDQPKFNIFSCMNLVECGFALSWRSTRFLRLTSMRHFAWFSCIKLQLLKVKVCIECLIAV